MASRARKIAWLLRHRTLWQDLDPLPAERHRAIVDALKKDGLVAHDTKPSDIRLTRLLADVRKAAR